MITLLGFCSCRQPWEWGLLKRGKLHVPKPQRRHHCAWQYRIIGNVQDPIEIPSHCRLSNLLEHYVHLSTPIVRTKTGTRHGNIQMGARPFISQITYITELLLGTSGLLAPSSVLLVQPANIKILQCLNVDIDKAFPKVNLEPPRIVLHGVRCCRCQFQ